jgi:hypothetical protein
MSQTNATVHAVDANSPSMSIHYEPFVVGMGVRNCLAFYFVKHPEDPVICLLLRATFCQARTTRG